MVPHERNVSCLGHAREVRRCGLTSPILLAGAEPGTLYAGHRGKAQQFASDLHFLEKLMRSLRTDGRRYG